MKIVFAIAFVGSLILASCAQKEEKREELKEEHNVGEKRNDGVPEAAMSDSAQVKDSMEMDKK